YNRIKLNLINYFSFFFSSRRRHTRSKRDWSSDVCSSDLIINISSVAAFIPQPKFATYAASKSYVLSFSRALNRELKPLGINVCALCPNPVNTEFFNNSSTQGTNKIKSIGVENLEKMVAKTLRLCHRKDLVTTHPVSSI